MLTLKRQTVAGQILFQTASDPLEQERAVLRHEAIL
jgi:hypothetical protein